MRSTGEVMGIADSFGMAFAKAQLAADGALPLEGAVFVTVNDSRQGQRRADRAAVPRAGLPDLATEGTARYLRARGIPAERVLKVHEGRPNAIDLIVSGQVQLLINTPLGKLTQQDDYAMRQAAIAAPGAVHDDAVRRRPRRATRSSRCGAAPARCGRCRSGTRWRGRCRPNGPGERARPGVRRGAARTGCRGEVREGGAARAVLHLPDRRAGHGAAARRRRRTWRPRFAWPREAGMPWFALGLGSNILLPDEGLDALVIRMGKGLDRLRAGRRALDASAPGCPRRSPRDGRPRRALPGCTSSWACPARSAAACT